MNCVRFTFDIKQKQKNKNWQFPSLITTKQRFCLLNFDSASINAIICAIYFLLVIWYCCDLFWIFQLITKKKWSRKEGCVRWLCFEVYLLGSMSLVFEFRWRFQLAAHGSSVVLNIYYNSNGFLYLFGRLLFSYFYICKCFTFYFLLLWFFEWKIYW